MSSSTADISQAIMKSTITLTFCDVSENHVGMAQQGQLASSGFNSADLKETKTKFEEKGFKCELINLNDATEEDVPDASVLVIRRGVEAFTSADSLFKEQLNLNWDKKVFMYGRVVNKNARYNLCYGDKAQEPDYENKKGRIVAWNDIPFTNTIRNGLPSFVGEKAKNMECEGNYYYNIKQCFIGWHGDAERLRVIGVRLGASMPLLFQWYRDSKTIGDQMQINLNHSDIYLMSETATGNNWKKRKIPTLRHAAGLKFSTK